MRTAFFIDGYNLFYGLLAHTPYKWLDLPALLTKITETQTVGCEAVSFEYFTAPVQPKLASRGEVSKQAQDSYIKALRAQGVRVINGRHQVDPSKAPLYVKGQQPNRQHQVDIWKIEEKETDVNLSIEMYRKATKSYFDPEIELDQLVLVSADTDMGPALQAIKEDYPNLKIGVILPIRETVKRSTPGSLSKHADWIVHKVSLGDLKTCQFPDRVKTAKKPAIKPDYW